MCRGKRLKRILPVILVLIAVIAIYSQVAHFEYAWDDLALFIDSPALRGGADTIAAITRPILPGTSYFRPAVLLSFLLEFKYWGMSATFSHLVNLALFLANIAMVGLLAWRLFPERRHLPALTMLLYGIHPAMIESVSWVAGRFDLMVTFFVLFGLLCYVGTERAILRVLGCSLAFFCAAASKEMAVVYPPLLGVIAVLALRERSLASIVARLSRRRDIWVAVSVFLAGLVYLWLRHHFLTSMANTDPRMIALSITERAAFVGQTILFYLRVCFLPFMDLGTMHPFDPVGMTLPRKLVGLIALLAFCGFCAWALWRRSVLALLALAWCVAILPVTNILPLTVGGNIGHERFMALPLVFLSLWAGYALLGLLDRGRITVYFGALAVVWSVVSIFNLLVTVPLWRDDVALWTWAYNAHPEMGITQFSVVSSMLRTGNLEDAGKYLKEIEAFYGGELPPRLLAIKGQWLQRSGRYEESIAALKKALEGGEMLPHEMLMQQGIDYRHSQVDLGSFNESWYLRFVYGAMAESYIGERKFDEAIEAVDVQNFYQPDYAPAQLLKALAYYGKDDVAGGDVNYEKAKSYYTPEQWPHADSIKKNFLTKLCSEDKKPMAVCARWSSEQKLNLVHE